MRAALLLLVLAGCDWNWERMNDQPRCEAGDHTPWLPDRRCDQRAPDGTVPWKGPEQAMPAPAPTKLTVARGADRYRRFCAPCHGSLGDARTPVARDMTLRPPPSLHSDLIVNYPDDRIFSVISNGYGMMPSYSYQLAPVDRWSIVHYVRVLQRSQRVVLQTLPEARRTEAQSWLK
jgi:mono/diheme cytochrome c family protein